MFLYFTILSLWACKRKTMWYSSERSVCPGGEGLKNGIKKNYHWVIAVLVFLEMVIFGGLINSASVFTLPISEGLGVSTTSYAVALMPYTVMCFIGTSFSGYLYAHFGYKKTAIASLLLVAVAHVVIGKANSLGMLCFGRILYGLGYGACFTAGSVRIIKDWFFKHQGLVLGAVNMATGLGGSLMTILLNGVIQKSGWRQANLTVAVIVTVLAVVYLLIKDRPEHMGLRPYGFGQVVKDKKKVKNSNVHWPGFSMEEQIKRPSFYIMCICVLASCTCIYMASSFMIPHFTSVGFSGDEAALYQSVYMLTLAAVKLLAGYLYDRFGAKPLLVICMSCAIVGQWMLGSTADPALSMVATMIFSVGLCMTSLMIPLLATPLFGYRGSMGINGIFLGLSSFASIFSNPLSSMVYDTTGTYGLGFRIAAIINIGVFALYLLLFRLSKKEQARYFALHPEEK